MTEQQFKSFLVNQPKKWHYQMGSTSYCWLDGMPKEHGNICYSYTSEVAFQLFKDVIDKFDYKSLELIRYV